MYVLKTHPRLHLSVLSKGFIYFHFLNTKPTEVPKHLNESERIPQHRYPGFSSHTMSQDDEEWDVCKEVSLCLYNHGNDKPRI